jgi:hypothetical protein
MSGKDKHHSSTHQEISHLELWLSEGAGVTLHDTERAICDELLPNYYGDVLLQAGIPSVPIYQKSATRRQIMMGVSGGAGELIGNPGQLPFANESIDVLVAQHLLDVGARPQFLVQELARTILPMGRLIVIGFNPLSLWSCRRVLAATRKGHQAQWGLAPRRLLDWLNLLNFKIDRIEFGGFGWPGQALGRRRPDFSLGLGRKYNMGWGGIYVVVAQRYKGAISAQRARMRRVRPFRPIAVAHTSLTLSGKQRQTRILDSGSVRRWPYDE